jgi:diguanylate cyclase
VTILFTVSQIFKDRGINPKSPMKLRVLLGLIGGSSTYIIINFSFHVTNKVILDFRHLIEILVAVFGGMIPAIITGIITSTYRLIYIGISYESIISSMAILMISIGCGFISMSKINIHLKLIAMFIYSLVVRSTVLYLLLPNKNYAFQVIIMLCISSIIAGLLIGYLVKYLVTSHNMILRLKYEANRDFLTGLNNTRYFDTKYNDLIKEAVKKNNSIAMFIIDIDHFKSVNDTYGHNVGDEVLRNLGTLLINRSEAIDIVSRIGGEEFVVIMNKIKVNRAIEIADYIRKSVEETKFILSSGKYINITVSIGVAIYPDTEKNIKSLKATADTKLYEAKHTGRNKVCI